MSSLIIKVVVWIVYFGLTAGAIVVDRNLQRAKAEREGSVDFMDRSLAPYLILGIFCGPLPLIFYFGTTRRSALGWLMGVGAALLVYTMTFVVAFALSLAAAAAAH